MVHASFFLGGYLCAVPLSMPCGHLAARTSICCAESPTPHHCHLLFYPLVTAASTSLLRPCFDMALSMLSVVTVFPET